MVVEWMLVVVPMSKLLCPFTLAALAHTTDLSLLVCVAVLETAMSRPKPSTFRLNAVIGVSREMKPRDYRGRAHGIDQPNRQMLGMAGGSHSNCFVFVPFIQCLPLLFVLLLP